MTQGPPPEGWPPSEPPREGGSPPPPYGETPSYGQPAYAVHPYGGYAYGGAPDAPYGVDPVTGMPFSDKSKAVAGLLQLLLPFIGICGVGRLYTGHIGIGLTQLFGMLAGYVLVFVLIGFLIVPAIWLWTVIDGVVMLAGRPRDQQGRILRP